MKGWLLGGGAIVSSAVAMGWTHPEILNLSLAEAKGTKPVPQEIETFYNRLLDQSQTVASQDQLAEAITTVSGIPKNSRSYAEAQQLQEDWTQELIQRARSHYQKANVDMALWMLHAIPPSSQQHARATELRKRWNEESAKFQQATAAKNQGDWEGVMAALKGLKESSLYQSLPAQEMLQQATQNIYSSNKTLVKLAGAASGKSKSVAVPSMPAMGNAVASPQTTAPDWVIDRDQALEWANPPAVTAFSAPEQMPLSKSNQASPFSPDVVPLEWSAPNFAPPLVDSSPERSVAPSSPPAVPAEMSSLASDADNWLLLSSPADPAMGAIVPIQSVSVDPNSSWQTN